MNTSPLEAAAYSIKHWYLPLLIGLVLLLLGVYVFITPLASYLALSLIFSISFLVSGILEIAFSIANRKELNSWGWYLAGGILYTLFGLILVSRPEISIATLPFVVGFFLLFKSANALAWAFDLKNMGVPGWGNIAIVAVLCLIFSFILLWNPIFAGISLVVWTGLAFVFAGFASILLSIQLKKAKNSSGKISDDLKRRIESIKHEYHQALSK
jgi:uncharacterized membrane protein HdeD (DUF308 family)